MSNEIVSDAAIQAAAAEMTTAIHAAVVDATARAVENGDHEAANIIKEVSDKLVGEPPVEPATSGIAPECTEVEVDLSGITVPAPAPLVIVSTSGITVGGVATAIAKGVAAGATAKVIGDALPSDMHWAARLGITVTGGVLAATAVGAAIDVASGWFGKDTV